MGENQAERALRALIEDLERLVKNLSPLRARETIECEPATIAVAEIEAALRKLPKRYL